MGLDSGVVGVTMVYVEGLPSSRVPEEGGHNVEGI